MKITPIEIAINDIPGLLTLTEKELLKILLSLGTYTLKECMMEIKKRFPKLTAEKACELIYQQPTKSGGAYSREEAQEALEAAGYSSAECTSALDKYYPMPTEYAAVTDHGSYLSASPRAAYNFGTGDFTLEVWIKTTEAGTVIARKAGPGGYNNGGFLMVINGNGSLKIATDDGMGFYEIRTGATKVMDNQWHHLAGVRRQGELSLYVDFTKLDSHVLTNRHTPLNVNNSNSLTLAFTEQYQEPYRHFQGSMRDIRIWSIVKIYGSQAQYRQTEMTGREEGLVGWWKFKNKDGEDSSTFDNKMKPIGRITYTQI